MQLYMKKYILDCASCIGSFYRAAFKVHHGLNAIHRAKFPPSMAVSKTSAKPLLGVKRAFRDAGHRERKLWQLYVFPWENRSTFLPTRRALNATHIFGCTIMHILFTIMHNNRSKELSSVLRTFHFIVIFASISL